MNAISVLKLLLFLLFLIFTITKKTEGLVGYDCSDPNNNMTKISLSSIKECPTESDIKLMNKTHQTIKVFQVSETSNIYIESCLIEATHLITRCGKSIDTFHNGGFYSEIIEIKRDECSELIKYGRLDGRLLGLNVKFENLVAGVDNKRSLVSHGSIIDGSCTPGPSLEQNGKLYERPIRQSTYSIMYRNHEATLDHSTGRLRMINGFYCNYLDEKCFLPDLGNSFWKNIFENQVCTAENPIKLIYSGDSIKTLSITNGQVLNMYSFTNKGGDHALAIHGVKKYCGYIPIFQTEHPLLFIVETPSNTLLDTINEKITTYDMDIITHLNSKLLYVMRHVKGQIDKLYEIFTTERCRLETQVLRQLQTTAYIAPNLFAYDYYGSPGYNAKVAGEVIYITKCKAVSVNYSPIPNKCYQDIPVKYNNKTMFIQPRSKLITLMGKEIDCSPIFRPYFKIGGGWVSPSPDSLIHTTTPLELDPNHDRTWEFNIPNNIINSGIYPEEIVNSYQKSLKIPDSEKTILANIAKKSITWQGDNYASVSLTNSITQTDIDYIEQRIFSKYTLLKWWGYLTSIGSGAIGIFIVVGVLQFIYSIIFNILTLRKIGASKKFYLLSPLGKLINYLLSKETVKKTNEVVVEHGIQLAAIRDALEEATALQKSSANETFA